MLSTALKDLGVEMGLFIMSSTQTNQKAEEIKGIKDESCIRGSRAIADKCDIGCIISEVTSEELDLLQDAIDMFGLIPNQVTDVYKVRRGRYNQVRIWSSVDLGNCRKRDLFITDAKYNTIKEFTVLEPVYEPNENMLLAQQFLEDINSKTVSDFVEVVAEDETIDIQEIEQVHLKKKGMFNDYL